MLPYVGVLLILPRPMCVPERLLLDDMSLEGQGVTTRYRLSWLTNSALVYEPKFWGEGGSYGVSANDYSCTQEPK
jgi:hypothetical protein